MEVTFLTNMGPQKVEITDNKVIAFISYTKNMRDNYGAKPSHPFDYISIAYQLYLEDKISESTYYHIDTEMTKIIKGWVNN